MTECEALAQLVAQGECTQLVHRYAQLADGHDVEGFVALFAADGSWGRADLSEIKGHDEIRRAYAGRPRSAQSRHVVLGVSVFLGSGGEATVSSTALVFKPGPDDQPVAHLVRYADRMARSPAGPWCIASRRTELLAQDLNLGKRP